MNHGWRDIAAARVVEREEAVKAAGEAAELAEQTHGRAMCLAARTIQRRAKRARERAEEKVRRETRGHRPPRAASVRWHLRPDAAKGVAPHQRRAAKPKIAPDETPAGLSLKSEQSAKACETTKILASCGCGWQMVDAGCGSSDCVACADTVAARRARRVRARVEMGTAGHDGRPVHFLSFTVPAELRATFVDPARWRAMVRGLVAELRAEPFGFLWAVEATHPVGDGKKDGGERWSEDTPPVDDAVPWEFAPHVNLIAFQRPDGGRRWFLNLDRLREVWQRILAGYGYTGQADDMVRPWVKVFWPNSKRRDEQIRWGHVTRYILRPFPGWSAWLPHVRWFGSYPKGLKYRCPCPKCALPYTLVAAGETASRAWHLRLAELGIREELPDSGAGPPLLQPVRLGPLPEPGGDAGREAAALSLVRRSVARRQRLARQAAAGRKAREARPT